MLCWRTFSAMLPSNHRPIPEWPSVAMAISVPLNHLCLFDDNLFGPALLGSVTDARAGKSAGNALPESELKAGLSQRSSIRRAGLISAYTCSSPQSACLRAFLLETRSFSVNDIFFRAASCSPVLRTRSPLLVSLEHSDLPVCDSVSSHQPCHSACSIDKGTSSILPKPAPLPLPSVTHDCETFPLPIS